MEPLFRLRETHERDPALHGWLDTREPDLGAIARRWFAVMRGLGDDVRECLHDGGAMACVSDAPFAYVAVFKGHVNVGFFGGSELDDPAGLLEGKGRSMRHVKVRPGAEPEAPMTALIEGAYAAMKRRVEMESRAG